MARHGVIRVFCAAALVLGLVGVVCAPARAGDKPRLAVVSLGVNDWGNSMSAGGHRNAAPFIEGAMKDLIGHAEKLFAANFEVVPASSFVKNPDYRALSIGKIKDGLFGPAFDGVELPSFSEDKKEVIKGVLKGDTAAKLCKTLGVDRVALVYTEWAVATGGFVPTSRALAKNCVAVYSADGKQRFFDREDVKGDKVIGGMGQVALTADTIGQWVDAYKKGMDAVVKKNLKKML